MLGEVATPAASNPQSHQRRDHAAMQVIRQAVMFGLIHLSYESPRTGLRCRYARPRRPSVSFPALRLALRLRLACKPAIGRFSVAFPLNYLANYSFLIAEGELSFNSPSAKTECKYLL
jgi:hypothetical protein